MMHVHKWENTPLVLTFLHAWKRRTEGRQISATEAGDGEPIAKAYQIRASKLARAGACCSDDIVGVGYENG